MKILHAISGVGRNSGGTAEVVPRLCREQALSGHAVALAMPNVGEEYSDEMKLALAIGVTVIPTPGFWNWKSYFCPGTDLPARARDIVRPYDIVHIHGLWQPSQWFIARACRQLGKPYVMMTHGFLEPERLKISKWKKRLVGWLVERRNLRHAKALVATSEIEAAGLRAYGLGNPIHIMPIGLDAEKFDPAHGERAGRGGKKRLLFFSRITPIKGLDMLIGAWSRLCREFPDWQLVITGPDDRGYAGRIKSYIASLGLACGDAAVDPCLQPSSAIVFTGPVYGEAKYAALRSADAFVLPTRSENWSIAVAEAMASALPVVCTRGAPWPCLDECGAGHWVDISSSAIERGLRSVLSLSDAERRAMGLNGRAWVSAHLSWPAIVSDVLGFYDEIIRPRPSATAVRPSIVIPVRNDAANLAECLPLLTDFDDVRIVDSQSTDETAAVAAKYGREVVQFRWNGRFPKKRNWALRNLKFKHEWVMFLDADERMTPAFASELSDFLASDAAKSLAVVSCTFDNWFAGRLLRHGDPMRKTAVVRRGHAEYERIDEDRWSDLDMEIHEHLQLLEKGPARDPHVIRARLEHHDRRPLESHWQKHVQYADWEAARYRLLVSHPDRWAALTTRQRRKYGNVARWWLAPAYFTVCYLLKLGFLDGLAGFRFAAFKFRYFRLIRRKILSEELPACAGGLSVMPHEE